MVLVAATMSPPLRSAVIRRSLSSSFTLATLVWAVLNFPQKSAGQALPERSSIYAYTEPVVRHVTLPAGDIVSPMYPDANYTDGVDVEWRFYLFPGDTFELDLDHRSPHALSTVEGDEDYVKLVIDGREGVNLLSPDNLLTHDNQIPWFGKTAIFREIGVTLKFHSDSANSGIGFRAIYKISCTNATYCKNGGTCEPQRSYEPFKDRVSYGDPQCICSGQFSGEHCENYLPCFELACEPGSSCHVDYATGHVGCKCVKPGFMDYQGKCVDVDECTLSTLPSSTGSSSSLSSSVCGENQACINTAGSYKCICAEGFRKVDDNPVGGVSAEDGPRISGNDDLLCILNRCPDKSWVWRDSQCYWFDPESRLLTYEAAVEECRDKSNSSSLVSILDAEENSFVGSNVVQPAIWLGLDLRDNGDDKIEAFDFWSSVMVGGETLRSPSGRSRRKRTVIHPTRKLARTSVRSRRKWQSGDPVGFTNWSVRRKGSKHAERSSAVMVPSRMAQASCSEKKRFICEAPADVCPQNWQLSATGNACYYQSAYTLDFVSAQETCQYLAYRGSLAKIDSFEELLGLSSWEFWRDFTGGSGLAHYWLDLIKNSNQAGWSRYSIAYQPQPAFLRWDKGFTSDGDGFSDANYPLCAYLLPNQWTVTAPTSAPVPSGSSTPMVGSMLGNTRESNFAGVVCKTPALAASSFDEPEKSTSTDEKTAGNSDDPSASVASGTEAPEDLLNSLLDMEELARPLL